MNKEITNEIKTDAEVIASMNIYTKLQKLRKDFHSMDIKKTGENKYGGFKYFELKDILPPTIMLLEKYNMTTLFNSNSEGATLILINADKPDETITFYIPDVECEIKSATAIQALGGKQTYLKKYCYFNLLEATESCMVDSAPTTTDASTGTYATTGYIAKANESK